MKRKLPHDAELTGLLSTKTNTEIASMFGCSKAAVSFHRKRLGIAFPHTPKSCCKCRKCHPEVSFHKDASRSDGLSAYCKTCAVEKNKEARRKNPERNRQHQRWKYENNRDQAIASAKRNYAGNKLRAWENKIKRSYGLTAEKYEAMLAAQGMKCAICMSIVSRSSSKKLFVDHCHASGKVRGLLCGNCNSLLGHAKDNPEILESAKDYLLKNS